MLKNYGPLIRQYAVVIAVNLSSLCAGMGIGWSSPVLVKLSNGTETVLSRPITDDEASWIVSIACPMTVIFYFLPAFLMDRLGRKYTVILTCCLRVIFGLVLTFATEVWMLLVGRAFGGFMDVMIMCVVPSYSAEVASKEIRGSLGTLLHVFISIGMLAMFSVGPFVSYFVLNVFYTGISLVCIIPLIFLPESPYFLYSKGRKEESLKVLMFLRSSKYVAQEEIKQYSLTDTNVKIRKMDLFKNRLFLKTLILTVIFGIGVQLVGHNVVLCYLQTILQLTETNVRADIASVVIGCIQLVSCFSTIFITDKFGRKPILAFSFVAAGVGLIGLGTFFKLKECDYQIHGFLNFMPILSLILMLFAHGVGFGALFLIVVPELFDGPSRATGVSIVITIATIIVFILTKYFSYVMNAIGAAATYWALSVNCVLICLFVIFFIPETKGKTFGEIQEALGAKKVDERNQTRI